MKLLVILARGLRAGAIGPYGNPWIDTPSLDALATRGIVFDWHFADRADPPGARRSWRTGLYNLPLPDGVHREEQGTASADLLEVLRAQNVTTWLLTDGSRSAPAEFEAGWQSVEKVEAQEGNTALEAVLGRAVEVIEELAERDNWLVWVELATLLPPWEVPDEFREPYFQEPLPEEMEEDQEIDEEEVSIEDVDSENFDEDDSEEEIEPLEPIVGEPPEQVDAEDDELFVRLSTSYAAAVSYLDAGIGSLLEALAEVPGGDEVGVVVTSDLGFPLGEHGVVGPRGPWLHEERIHLPLIVRLPRQEIAGRHIDALTQSVDLAPTLANWFGGSLPGCHGRDLTPLMRWQPVSDRDYICLGTEMAGQPGWALRTHDRALLVVAPTAEETRTEPKFYVKPDDPWEVSNVFQPEPDRAEELEKLLFTFLKATTITPWAPPPPKELVEEESVSTDQSGTNSENKKE